MRQEVRFVHRPREFESSGNTYWPLLSQFNRGPRLLSSVLGPGYRTTECYRLRRLHVPLKVCIWDQATLSHFRVYSVCNELELSLKHGSKKGVQAIIICTVTLSHHNYIFKWVHNHNHSHEISHFGLFPLLHCPIGTFSMWLATEARFLLNIFYRSLDGVYVYYWAIWGRRPQSVIEEDLIILGR